MLCRMFIDDAGLEGKHTVERGLAAITAVIEPLVLADTGAAAVPAAQQAVGVQQHGLWQQRVALQLVSKVSLLLLGLCAQVQECWLCKHPC